MTQDALAAERLPRNLLAIKRLKLEQWSNVEPEIESVKKHS